MIRECPIFFRPHSKAILSRAIHNDTEFLAQQMVMDYSLLVGIDEARSELVTGIIGEPLNPYSCLLLSTAMLVRFVSHYDLGILKLNNHWSYFAFGIEETSVTELNHVIIVTPSFSKSSVYVTA